jgi:hypothetical protein
MHPPGSREQLLEVHTIGPHVGALICVNKHFAHAPASLTSHGEHVVCVAPELRHAATNESISDEEQALLATIGFASVVGVNALTSHCSHAILQVSGFVTSAHGPACATGFGAPALQTETIVPSHAQYGIALHAPELGGGRQCFVAPQPSLTGYAQTSPPVQDASLVHVASRFPSTPASDVALTMPPHPTKQTKPRTHLMLIE